MASEDAEAAMKRFEALAKRLFSIAKKDIVKVEEAAEDLATDILPKRESEPTGEE